MHRVLLRFDPEHTFCERFIHLKNNASLISEQHYWGHLSFFSMLKIQNDSAGSNKILKFLLMKFCIISYVFYLQASATVLQTAVATAQQEPTLTQGVHHA